MDYNKLFLEEVSSGHKNLCEAIKKASGGKIDPSLIEWQSPSFKWTGLENLTQERFMEAGANSSTSLAQLTRYGIQQFMLDSYRDVKVVYPDLVDMRTSGSRQEYYAPLYAGDTPVEVVEKTPFDDSRIEGLDTLLVNKKVGKIISIQRELFEDDQTGQVAKQPSSIGKRMRYKEEFDTMGAIRGATYNTTIGNSFASNQALTQGKLEDADVALYNMLDPKGNRMAVEPSVLLVSPADKFNAGKLLNSALQPSVPSSDAGGAGAGATGWTMTQNPLQGLYELKVSRFLGAGDWFLMEPKTSIPFQNRRPLEVVQENPQSGKSFDMEVFRWKVSRRYAVTVIESRYIFAGFINATAPTI